MSQTYVKKVEKTKPKKRVLHGSISSQVLMAECTAIKVNALNRTVQIPQQP